MKNNHYHYIAILVFSLIALFFVFGVTHVGWVFNLVHGNADSTFMNKIGTFGDSAGLLNALFSSLAFGGVLLTIFWQITENKKQRDDEHRMQFESVFFSMTNTLERIVSELRVKRDEDNVVFGESLWDEDNGNTDDGIQIKDQIVKGREVFKYLYEEIQPSIAEVVVKGGIDAFEQRMTGIFDSYFRYLYRILKYIDDSNLINPEVKYQYAGILRAHLSYMELPFIYYNCLSSYGRDKMKPLVEKYHLLKNIREVKLHGQEANYPIEGLTVDDMYNISAWKYVDNKLEMKENSLGKYLWRLFDCVLIAMIFNALLSDMWCKYVISKWVGMSSETIWGVILIAVGLNMVFFRIMQNYYQRKFKEKPVGIKTWEFTWNLIKGDYVFPITLALLIISINVNVNHQVVWYNYHIAYLDFILFFMPLLMSFLALTWEIVEYEDNNG